ncbi:MAG TPA: hypothetical protein VHF25_03960, partial [Nitriliruptorales bacterium]|nr:hypothetical protein [Nitriliruptorales bacterium]
AFPDGVAAGAAAGAARGLLVLIDGQDLDRSAASAGFLRQRADRFQALMLAGGPAAISEDTEQRLRAIVAS